MTDGKPGTSLVPVKSKKILATGARGAASHVTRRISELAKYVEPPANSHGAIHSTVDQSGSKVRGDQVGGDKIEGAKVIGDILDGNAKKVGQEITIHMPASATVVEKLLSKLEHEINNNIAFSDTIARLERYHGGVVRDGVIGLVNKLKKAGRDSEIESALEQKEDFAKLLETWSLYLSAQEIFVYLLARAEHTFNSEVMPELESSSVTEINRLVNREIVNPVVEECAMSVLQLDHVTAMGMLYWLAEQCFIRWH